MSRTLVSQLPNLGAALRRAAKQHAPRWLSESWEAASAQLGHPSRTAGNAVQSRHAAGTGSESTGLGRCQQHAYAHSRPPHGLSSRSSSHAAEPFGASRSMMPLAATSRMLLTSTLVPAAHGMHSAVSQPTGCALSSLARAMLERLCPALLNHLSSGGSSYIRPLLA